MAKVEKRKTQSSFTEIGVTGLRSSRGYVMEEFQPELQGSRGRQVFRKMASNDPIIKSILRAIGLVIRGVKWKVDPAEKSGTQGEAEAEFVTSLMDDMSHTWEDFISECLSMLIYGWSYHEIVLKSRNGPLEKSPDRNSKFTDGRIGIRKLAPRPQDTLDRWGMQDDGGITGMYQRPANIGGEYFIPIERALLFRTESRKNNPEGESIIRAAYESWYHATNIRNFESVGIERDLAGLPIVRIPSQYFSSSASPEDIAMRNKYEAIATQVKMNEQGGLLIPSDTFKDEDGKPSSQYLVDVQLLSASGKRATDTSAVITRHQRDMARSVLADFIMLGSDSKGSYALSKDKSDFFLRACEALIEQITAPINRYLLPTIWDLNGLDRALLPKFSHEPLAEIDLVALGAFIQTLSSAGAPLFPDLTLETFLRNAASLPPPDEDALAIRDELHEQQADLVQSQIDRNKPAGEDDGQSQQDLSKFDDSEPRDWHGRWTSGGASGTGSVFVSPNTGNLDFQGAVAALRGQDHLTTEQAIATIDRSMHLHSDVSSVIGAWADGAENSTMTITRGATFEQLKSAAATKGLLANQKQVLIFQHTGEGNAFLSSFNAQGSLESIHADLLAAGLQFHTLQPSGNGAKVFIYGEDRATLHTIAAAAARYGSHVTTKIGRGEFIGTTKEDGTDAEQRADARNIYARIIRSGGVSKHDIRKADWRWLHYWHGTRPPANVHRSLRKI